MLYTYTVRNPGDVPLSGVAERITDDTCSPVAYVSGDEDLDTGLIPRQRPADTVVRDAYDMTIISTTHPEPSTNVAATQQSKSRRRPTIVLVTVALGGLFGTAALLGATDSGSPTAPAVTVADGATRRIGSADTTERWTQMNTRPTADAPSLHGMSADAAERWAEAQAATMSSDPYVSADTAERSADTIGS